jgi:hypothetical protein
MKKYIVENGGYVHMVLFIIWILTLIVGFCCGSLTPIWISLTGLIAIVIQLYIAIMEGDWTEQVLNNSGYEKVRDN